QIDPCVIETRQPPTSCRRPCRTVVQGTRAEARAKTGREHRRGESRPPFLSREHERDAERDGCVEANLVEDTTEPRLDSRERSLHPGHSTRRCRACSVKRYGESQRRGSSSLAPTLSDRLKTASSKEALPGE